MIRLNRPYPAPSILTDKGVKQTAADIAARRAGTLDFEVKRAIYAHSSVKSELSAMSSDKCAYCESKIGITDFPNIDHFRPSAAWRNSRESLVEKPGYFWLAYNWENLLPTCQQCNCIFKHVVFPLADPAGRVTEPNAVLSGEGPLLIDPSKEDPNEWLRYRFEMAYSVDANDRGNAVIKTFGLNDREPLVENRRELLETIEVMLAVAIDHPDTSIRQKARTKVLNAMLPSSEYSAMIATALAPRLHELPT